MTARTPILALSSLAAVAVALILSSSALACSCAGRPGKDIFRATDAAVIAKLIRVDESGGDGLSSNYVYRIRASFKRTDRFRPGQTRTIRSASDSAMCGISQPVGTVTGIYLNRDPSGSLSSNLCLTTSPARIRKTAEEVRGAERLTSASPTGACAAAT